MLRWLARRQLLCVDDLGTSTGSESEKAHLFDVLDTRYREKLFTLIATNLDRKALAEYVGARIFDRFREGGMWIVFDWKSARGNVGLAAVHGERPELGKPEEEPPEERRLIV